MTGKHLGISIGFGVITIVVNIIANMIPNTSGNLRRLCTEEYEWEKSIKKVLLQRKKVHKIIERQNIEGEDIIYGNAK